MRSNPKHYSPRSKRYDVEFKRAAVEMVLHGGKSVAQAARDLGVSEQSLNAWKKAALAKMDPIEVDGATMTPQEMAKELRRQQKEIDSLRMQRDILKKAMSILGEDPSPRMR